MSASDSVTTRIRHLKSFVQVQMVKYFGKYELTRRIAFGGMAEVFLATRRGKKGFAKKVGLKRILPQFGRDPEFVQLFIDEALLAARLNHPNIAQVVDFGEVDGTFFIAMEWVEGFDLRTLAGHWAQTGRQLSFAQVAAIGEGICRGLGYAHNFVDDDGRPLHIVHRDISPHNIMLSRHGEVKVMDFGIAKAEQVPIVPRAGKVRGKVAYMAPEQAEGRPVDKRADQFSVGLVLWECLTGRRLFAGDSDSGVLRQIAKYQVVSPSVIRQKIPQALDAVLVRALAPHPEERYADLREIERELASFRFSLGADGAVQLGRLVDEAELRPFPKRGNTERTTLPLPEPTLTVTPTMNVEGMVQGLTPTPSAPLRHAAATCGFGPWPH